MSDKYKLDGSDDIRPTPFDAHEQVVRSSHEHVQGEGYKAKDYEHAEYPKAVDHVGGEPVLVNSAEEEKSYLEAQKEEQSKDIL